LQDFLEDPTSRSLSNLAGLLPDHKPQQSASDLLTKVVLARRTGVTLQGPMHGLQLLSLLQQSNPSSYQVALVLPEGAAFVASTPERLFRRHGRIVFSEAVAGVPLLQGY
jgi:isochorismate synthase EntC